MAQRAGSGAFLNIEGEIRSPVDPIGTSQLQLRIIQGLDGVMREMGAVAQEIRSSAQNIQIITDRNQMMYGRSGGLADTRGITQDMKEAVAETLVNMTPGKPSSEAPRPQRTSARPPSSDVPSSDAPLSNLDEYQRRANIFRDPRGQSGLSIGGLRQEFGKQVQERMKNLVISTPGMDDFEGQMMLPGVFESEDPVTRGVVQRFIRGEKASGAIRGGAEVLAKGGTFKEAGITALPPAAAKFAGGAAAALYAVDKIGDFAERQRSENAEWQRITGGSNLDAMGERFGQRAFGMRQFGFMDSGEAQRLYRGIAETGQTGDERQRSQQFALQSYSEFGMSIDQSLQVIRTASRTGQDSLIGFSQALRQVTDSAKEAGVNTEVARQRFVDTWETFTQTLGGGSSTIMAAAGFAEAATGMGRQFQGVDQSGIGSEGNIRMLSSQMGISPGEFMAQNNQSGGVLLAQSSVRHTKEVLSGQIGRKGMGVLQQFLSNRPDPTKALTDSEMEDLSNRMWTEGEVDPFTLPKMIAQVLGVTGLTPETAIGFAANNFSGNYAPDQDIMDRQAMGQTREIGGQAAETPTVSAFGSYGRGNPAAMSMSPEVEALRSEIEATMGKGTSGVERQMLNSYLRDVEKTRRAGGISEMLMMDPGARAAIKKIEVQTAGGPRIVDMQTALDHFRDQIESGEATIMEGDQAGTTLADALKTTGATAGQGGFEGVTSSEDESLAKKGMSVEEWNKEHKDSVSGTIILAPTDELRRLIRPEQQWGAASWSPEWNLSQPPTQTTPNTRATG